MLQISKTEPALQNSTTKQRQKASKIGKNDWLGSSKFSTAGKTEKRKQNTTARSVTAKHFILISNIF
jgi:hypothetical protein